MTPMITSVNLNSAIESQTVSVPDPIVEDASTPPTDVLNPETANDIDTDELESLLLDLKQTKKQNNMPPKKRVRKPKVIQTEPMSPEPVVEAVVEPIVEAVVEPEAKPKRKYIRKPPATPAQAQTPVQEPVEEPPKRSPGNLIEEMQKAERALRYQMRKNKMQTLVSHAF